MEQTTELDDFISIYENVISPDLCVELINDYQIFRNNNITWTGSFTEGNVSDTRTAYPSSSLAASLFEANKRKFVFEAINNHCVDYMKKYAEALPYPTERTRMMVEDAMLQETHPSGGFHVWHYEAMDLASSGRCLTWILYLNDIKDGGETEFLYQRKRLSPTRGTLVIWPTGFTHTHRGNPPLKETKYVLTGWHRWIR